jgi:hypothetical protein
MGSTAYITQRKAIRKLKRSHDDIIAKCCSHMKRSRGPTKNAGTPGDTNGIRFVFVAMEALVNWRFGLSMKRTRGVSALMQKNTYM